MRKVIWLLGVALLFAPVVNAGKGPILLVDDDGSDGGYADVRMFYTDALDGSGFWGQYDVWEVPYSSDGPTAADMAPYGAIIWFTGEIYGQGNTVTLTQNDESNLATYLDGGGKLFLASQDYWWDRYSGYGSFSPGEFPYDYLQARDAIQDPNPAQPFTAYGNPSTIGAGMTLSVSGATPVPQYYDQFTHVATECFNDGAASVGIQYQSGVYQLVWFAWPFENVIDGASPNTKQDLIYAVLTWFGLTPPTDDVGIAYIGSPAPVVEPYTAVTPIATIVNYGSNPHYDFNVACTIDSAGTLVYHDSVQVDSLIPSESKQIQFPQSDPLGEGITYTLTVFHNLMDQNPSNDTLSMQVFAKWGCVYDDGEMDSELRSDYEGCEVANRLTPPAYPYAVDSIAVYVSGYYLGVPFEVRLYEDGGGQPPANPVGLIPPILHSAQSWQWWVDNIVPYNIVVVSGDFYLVVKYLADSWGRTPVVGLDEDPPIYDRGWWANVDGPPPPYDWTRLRVMGYYVNPMMRAYGHQLVGVAEGQEARIKKQEVRLFQNYPNPFAHTTTIPYSVPSAVGGPRTAVSLSVYDLAGRLVRTLFERPAATDPSAPTTAVLWDGRNESGSLVQNGVYFCRLAVGEYGATRKLILIR